GYGSWNTGATNTQGTYATNATSWQAAALPGRIRSHLNSPSRCSCLYYCINIDYLFFFFLPGYEGYDYYNTQTTAANTAATYNYAAATSSSWETPKTSDMSMNADVNAAMPVASYGAETSANENSDSIIAKINQRLDMLSKEGSGGTGEGMEDQESSFRFESFESYDSRSSMNDRDMYRSGYDYGDVGTDRNDSFGSQFDNRRDQSRNRGNNYGLIRGRGQNRVQNRGRLNAFNR
ncbi:A-kinase anchor protein 8, partial [Podiceps cristatus]